MCATALDLQAQATDGSTALTMTLLYHPGYGHYCHPDAVVFVIPTERSERRDLFPFI